MSIKYFYDSPEGWSVELAHLRPAPIAEFKAMGVTYKRCWRNGPNEIEAGLDEFGCLLPVTRKIEYKKQPSLHECDARCLGGSPTGKCECRCGGKNHGKGN